MRISLALPKDSYGTISLRRCLNPEVRIVADGWTWANWVYWIALILVIVGGLNWLLVGLFDFDLVAAIFGVDTALSNAVYVIVGLAAIYLIIWAPMRASRPTRART